MLLQLVVVLMVSIGGKAVSSVNAHSSDSDATRRDHVVLPSITLFEDVSDIEVASEEDEFRTASGFETDYTTPLPHLMNELVTNGTKERFLRVERPLVNMTRFPGQKTKLLCAFSGYPTPVVRWYKNEAPLQEERGRVDIRIKDNGKGHVSSRVRLHYLDTLDTAFYKCEASNDFKTVETTGILKVNGGNIRTPNSMPEYPPVLVPHFPALGGSFPDLTEGEDDATSLGVCQVYRGATCSEYIANKTVYFKSLRSQGFLEEKLAAAFTVIATLQDVSAQCQHFAIPFFCYFAFPLCDESSLAPKPRQVCRDECEALEYKMCRLEYFNAKRHPVISQQNILPVCKDLPPIGSKESQNCVRLGVPNAMQINPKHTCFVGTGDDYRGTVSYTASGLTCQHWSQQVYYQSSEYPELTGGHNFCRNPGSTESQPWCFTKDSQTHRELCDIPKCVDYTWLYILLPTIAIVVLLGLTVGFWCMKRRSKPPQTPKKLSNVVAGTRPMSQLDSNQRVEMNALLPKPKLRVPEIPLSSVRFLQQLGEGAFGKVYRGELLGIHGPGSSTSVTIKTLKENESFKMRQDFWQDAEIMSGLRHPNIVCLLGVCFQEDPLCMLFEYMSGSDLREYLVSRSPHADPSVSGEENTQQILELPDLFNIMRQVACGMEFLSGHHYVHRDLATRNCLIDESLTVKISDFGRFRDIYSADYYRIQSKSLLPIRWMSPESILYGKFSTECDVWSFGVVMWEVFSFGLQPYYGYNNQEVIDMIRSRQLLPCPEVCPPHMYAMMVECWHEIPTRRPSFRELHGRLCSWQAMHARTLSLAHSASTHNGSQHSSTGPSNNTGSTNLSSNLGNVPGQNSAQPPHRVGLSSKHGFSSGRDCLPAYLQPKLGVQHSKPVTSSSPFITSYVTGQDGKVSNV
ncbi:inactive tyrosine-protein kinase transmembrane receptor ROR1-like [Limulus polyphemus]|uniref:receptor protein-tyrosine kinase n=1 Tax=Limulus polyphemus TaxID=6850 RepID=A0ABM1BEY7_LIMPO|nr:inactive tyrosine-protein kinase transmembrane receptor ROR1-like [Limulus polyphemus]